MDIATAAEYSDLDWSEQLGQPVAAEPAVVAAVVAEHILDLGKDSADFPDSDYIPVDSA